MQRNVIRNRAHLALCAATAIFGAANLAHATATVTMSTPYLSSADSTLNPLSPTYYLENFEDGNLNLPGVSFSAIGASGPVAGMSVDADDNSIDGSGAAGNSFQSITAGGQNNLTFFFSQVGGQWPKQVAIAMTWGQVANLGFNAYDTNLNPSGGMSIPFLNLGASTSDDILVTFIDNSGIAAINIQTNLAAINFNFDHLQFDTAEAVPEPASLSLVPLAAMILRRRR